MNDSVTIGHVEADVRLKLRFTSRNFSAVRSDCFRLNALRSLMRMRRKVFVSSSPLKKDSGSSKVLEASALFFDVFVEQVDNEFHDTNETCFRYETAMQDYSASIESARDHVNLASIQVAFHYPLYVALSNL